MCLNYYLNAPPANAAAIAKQANILITVPHSGSGCVSLGRFMSLFLFIHSIYELALNTLYPQPSTHHVFHSTGRAWIGWYYGQISDLA